jgi:acetaldehyde dehydrogenase/alcohol dehydrogenase
MNELAQRADEVMEKAALAAAEFNQLDQAQTDAIVERVARAGFEQRVRLAKMAHEETKLGVWQHKVIKNVVATQLVYEDIRHERTVGVLSDDPRTGITEIAQPLGPVFAVTPVTNPTSTVLYKILICLKTRNPIIISPHRRSVRCCAETVRICLGAALAVGAPEECIQLVKDSSRELTQTIMAHPRLALILATGGTGLVKEAYSSGTPAIGVGPGNVPVFIDRSADLPFAVASIITSKAFDNGTVCASEQAVVVEQAIADAAIAEFRRQGCHFLSGEEVSTLEKVAVNSATGTMSPEIVGQGVAAIAEMAGLSVPEGTKILMAPLGGVGRGFPLSGEVLAPILAFYTRPDYPSAIKLCIDLNYLGGIGHSAAVYSNDEARIREFSELMNAGRVVVNTPSSQGAVGGIYNTLLASFTLGCGSGGKNITTENISARHLINIKRIARRRDNSKLAGVPVESYLDESLGWDALSSQYHRNS